MCVRIYVVLALLSVSAYSKTSDITPPAQLSFLCSPTSSDTRSGPKTLTFTSQVSDDFAGVWFVTIDLRVEAGPPGSASGPPGYTLTLPLRAALPAATELDLFRLDPISGNLVFARVVSAANVKGTVDLGGETATFTGMASFSTVVGLLPSAQKPGDVNGDNIVDCADASVVRATFGKHTGQTGFDTGADVNRDGLVNISDLSFVLRQLPAGSSCQ